MSHAASKGSVHPPGQLLGQAQPPSAGPAVGLGGGWRFPGLQHTSTIWPGCFRAVTTRWIWLTARLKVVNWLLRVTDYWFLGSRADIQPRSGTDSSHNNSLSLVFVVYLPNLQLVSDSGAMNDFCKYELQHSSRCHFTFSWTSRHHFQQTTTTWKLIPNKGLWTHHSLRSYKNPEKRNQHVNQPLLTCFKHRAAG